MSALELREEIIQKLQKIEDVSFLEVLRALISRYDKPNYLELDQDFLDELNKVKEDTEQGNYIAQEALDKKLNAWLAKK
jgi:hypothetical protein